MIMMIHLYMYSLEPPPFLTPSSNQHRPVEPASIFPEPEGQQPGSEREDAEEDYISMYIMCNMVWEIRILGSLVPSRPRPLAENI